MYKLRDNSCYHYPLCVGFLLSLTLQYSDELPSVHIVPGTDYKQMMADKGMIGALTDSVVHPFAAGKETSLSNKYKNLYFYNEKIKRVD